MCNTLIPLLNKRKRYVSVFSIMRIIVCVEEKMTTPYGKASTSIPGMQNEWYAQEIGKKKKHGCSNTSI